MALHPLQYRLARGRTTIGEVLLVILLLAVGAAAAYISGDGFQVHPGLCCAPKENRCPH